MKIFDSRTIELAGRNLIEASAGTGKTYAIASLYVRLLVEKGLLPENILVVTFTEAATKELRDRIRRRIRDARDAFSGQETTDELLLGLLGRAGQAAGGTTGTAAPAIPAPLALERLDAALQTFDCAAISTIHGFCNRALQENAFESGSLYDTELTADQNQLVQGLVDDYWRINFFSADADLLPLAEAKGWSPEGLTRFLKGKLGNPELELIPAFTADQVADVAAGCSAAFEALAGLWQARRDELATTVREHRGLSRSAANYHPDLIDGLLEGMDAYLAGAHPYRLFDGFAKFTSGFIESQRLKKNDPPRDPFFDACQELANAVEQRCLTLLWGLFEFVRDRLPQQKAGRNIRFYDDLLVELYRALQGANGQLLAGRIRGRFRAGLIDEFQDTDQVQYRIFREIFNDETIPLFLIGDPKQAIYSFRGADIFAYLRAKSDIPENRHFTMDKNWRSAPPLVEAINRLFSRQQQRPLLFEQLEYPRVTAVAKGQALTLEGRDPAALQLWFMDREEGSVKPIDMNRARPRIVAAVVAEIAGLLADGGAGRATIAGQSVRPGDIAVIVRSHGQAGLIHEQLIAAGIPAVVRSNASIFASAEAGELFSLLGALVEPGREGLVRNALVTTIMGATGNELAALLDESGEAEWERRLAAFREYHDIWRTAGVMAMFRSLVRVEGVRGRLLSLPGGERRLTNLLHCGELLHNQEGTARMGMEALLAWFGERVARPPEGEEHQLRLESDEEAVRILTIHVSKGLEFPIVFCPFSWGGVFDDGETVVCHAEGRILADFGSGQFEQHRQLALKESLAENLRLLYVALTRAKYRCYLVWGRFKHVESSALAYLLHGPGDRECADPLGFLAGQMKDLADEALLQALSDPEGKELLGLTVDPLTAPVEYRPAAQDGDSLTCRTVGRAIEVDWHVSSFTAFVEGHLETAELPDHDGRTDAEPGPLDAAPPEGSLFAFPRGAKAGTFLHGILEKVDFTDLGEESLARLVGGELAKSGFGGEWSSAICGMIRQVAAAPLGRGDGCFSLSRLAKKSWISEMEFYFPLRLIGSGRLAALLKRHGASSPADLGRVAERLNFREVAGMLRGFIDLVFQHQGKYYLLDWKSNHLGNRVEEYAPGQLAREMEAKLYPLQYLLYTVALNRHLERRDPAYRYGEHFGGVLYLFLRGIDAERPGFGVFHDIPDAALVRELTDCLIDCEGN